ncbi:hypothetical protein GCM10022217_25680 [Chryseobacterium ginsenosidimutans]|uniref:DUF6640 family protein n=1 Tax=Chryseobacterium ginsenosidimutans TaxID=687846 RepID=UPI0031D79A49
MTAMKISTGKIILSCLGIFTSISPYLADWNITHIYNPAWPPHAKFHNAQTMVLGTFLGILTLYCVWFRNSISAKQKLNEATTLVSLYWLAQLPAILFPGTQLQDPGIYHVEFPKIFGIEFNQLTMDITVLLPLILLAYYLEYKTLKTAPNN